MRDKAKELLDKIADAKRKVHTLEENQAYVIQLIETAQRRRPDFPLP